MKALIVGAGQVGRTVASELTPEHSVVAIDRRYGALDRMPEAVRVVQGDGGQLDVLEAGGVGEADVLIACTDDDRTNILVCSTAQLAADLFAVARVAHTRFLETWHHSRKAFGVELLEAEAPGPHFDRLVPRITDTARRLWILYAGLTALEIVLLYGWHLAGWAPNMSLFNAVVHGLTTMPTGGFSPEARSIEAFAPLVQWTVIPFMFLAGTSLALTWRVATGALRPQSNEEFRTYVLVLAVVALLLGAALAFEQTTGSLEETARHAVFQALTMITTTGYASTDFNTWGGIAVTVMFLAMFVGGSTGSTGGGIKVMRWIVSTKAVLRELFVSIHPSAVRPIRLGRNVVENRVVRQVVLMIVAYFLLTLVSTAVIEAENVRIGLETDTLSVLSTVAASIGNIGPGFGLVGPMENYLAYSDFTTLHLALLMWVGRLEIFTVLILFTRAYWCE